MTQTPEVSVLMATANRPSMLRQAVDSIIVQQNVSWELIVLHVGEDHPTGQYLQALNDTRIRYIACPNVTQAQALNIGLQHAQGKYVAFQDDDDVSHPARLASCRTFLMHHKADGVIPNYAILHEQDRLEFVGARYLPKLVFLPRARLLALGGFRPFFRVHEDLDLQLRWEEQNWKIIPYPKVLYFYRNHLGQRVSDKAMHYGGLYALAAQFSAYARRHNAPDPVETGQILDDILAQFRQIPQPMRNRHIDWYFFNSAKYGLQRRARIGEVKGFKAEYADIANILQICGYAGNIPRKLSRLRLSLWFLYWRERFRTSKPADMTLADYMM